MTFSDTRFANSKRKVFKNIHHEFAPIITCLEDQIVAGVKQISGEAAPDKKTREKANEARTLKGKILNVEFLLTLSGLVDIYEQFGAIVQVTQMVRLLPHERYDLYTKGMKHMKDMALTLDHNNCGAVCGQEQCLWPTNHADKKSLKDKSSIRNLPVLESQCVGNAGLGTATRRNVKVSDSVEKTVERSDSLLKELVNELHKGLSEDVYSTKGKAVIEETRVVLDLPTLALQLKKIGASPINVSISTFPKLKNAITNIPIQNLKNVPEDELRYEFRLFLQRLGDLTKSFTKEQLTKIDSKDLIQQFFDPENQLFKNIEMIMEAIAVSSVKYSCESILESFVSRYENHFDMRRSTAEDSTNEEFEIAVNGPSLAHCDSVVSEAMNSYWASRGGSWHFFKKTVIEKLSSQGGASTVVKRMMNTKNNFPFMS